MVSQAQASSLGETGDRMMSTHYAKNNNTALAAFLRV